jgi:hypothetical protein
MKSYSIAVRIGIVTMIMEIFALSARTEVLELGASELHGKKDQPEAMTFISRARINETYPVPEWHAREQIKQEIENPIFSVPKK